MSKFFLLALACAATVTVAQAQSRAPATTAVSYPLGPPSSLRLDRYEGTPLRTDLGYGVVTHPFSSLRREWYVLRDDKAPAALEGEVGVRFSADLGADSAGPAGLSVHADWRLATREEPVRAVEFRLHLLDVFGQLIRTLATTELADVDGPHSFQARWSLPPEPSRPEIFATVAYVARARTAEGRVYEVDSAALLEQLRKVARHMSEHDLEPRREARAP